MPSAVTRPPLHALTGLRFVAAAHVVAYHFGALVVSGAGAPVWVSNLLAGGDAAVSLFFVLSGFVLTYTYADKGHLNRRDFWAARFARVYPAFVLAMLLIVPSTVQDLGLGRAALMALPTLTLTHAWVWQTATKWNFPSWSLSAEAFFYLLFPFILARVRAVGRRVFLAVLVLWGLLLIAPAAYTLLDPDHVGDAPRLWNGPWLSTVAYNPLLHLPEFLMGMLCAHAFLARRGPAPLGVVALGAVAAAVGVFLLGDTVPVPFLHNGLLAPAFALLVYALAAGGGPLAWLLSRRPLVLLGEASYAMYILQYPVWYWTTTLLGKGEGPVVLVEYFAVLIACSLLCLVMLERPARRFLRGILVERSRPAPVLLATRVG